LGNWKLTAKNVLRSVGFPLHKLPVIRPPMIDPYAEDPELIEIYTQVASDTVVDRERMFMLRQFARNAASLPGDAAEVGVYRGGTARLLAKSFAPSGKKVLLFDTFEGMPETSATKDLHRAGDFADTSLEHVKRVLDGCTNVEYYKGFFPQSAAPVVSRKFCFAHIDVDIYQSILDCCEFFYPRLSPGGVLVFDDYGFLSCPGVKSALDKFFADKPESALFLFTGQAFMIKYPPN
jgi:O-methyltransferase